MALLDFTPNRDGEMAGICVLANERHHYEMAVTRQRGARSLIVRRRIGDLEALVYEAPLDDGLVTLALRSDSEAYHFGYGLADGAITYVCTGATRYVSTEVAGGFTGVYIGLYASGNGQASQSTAYVDWFDYRADLEA